MLVLADFMGLIKSASSQEYYIVLNIVYGENKF